MKLDVEIIYEKLQNAFDFQLFKGNNPKMIRGICCFNPNNLSGDNMCIMNKNQYLNFFYEIHDSVIILISDSSLQNINPSNDILVFPEHTDIPALMSCVSELISSYDNWAEAVCQCENSFEGIKQMMDISRHFAKGAFILVDINLYYLYYTNDFLQYGFLSNNSTNLPTDDIVKVLLSDEDYHRSYESKDVFFFPKYEYPNTALCWNIFGTNGDFQARLMFLSKEKVYGVKEKFILQYLGQKIGKTIQANPVYTFPITSYQRFRESIVSLIQGNNIDKNDIEKNLKKVGWHPADQYRVFVFIQPTNNSRPIALDNLCSSVEVLFTGGFANVHNQVIYLLVNQSVNPIFDVEEKLTVFCNNYRMLAGVSEPYTDLYKTRFATKAATAAIEIGFENKSNTRCYYFRDCVLEYLIHYGNRAMPKEFVAHSAVKLLKQYDQKNSTAYLETLKVFLEENGSATRTARRLFIHRSTLLERIDRIKIIGQLDNIFDWKTKLHLMLSLTD